MYLTQLALTLNKLSFVSEIKIKDCFTPFYFVFHSTCINFASMLKNILLVALGGACGSVARYLLSKLVQDNALSNFPFGTMTVNILGCLLIGMVYGLAENNISISPALKLLLTVGFCGGFTTFSTFMNESLSLLRADSAAMMALYVGGSVALGLLAVFAGLQIIKLI